MIYWDSSGVFVILIPQMQPEEKLVSVRDFAISCFSDIPSLWYQANAMEEWICVIVLIVGLLQHLLILLVLLEAIKPKS